MTEHDLKLISMLRSVYELLRLDLGDDLEIKVSKLALVGLSEFADIVLSTDVSREVFNIATDLEDELGTDEHGHAMSTIATFLNKIEGA